MPDIHWGYGFCIGGVCATDPNEDGVISPGGVGYDINCLAESSLVLNKHGYSRRIGEMASDWPSASLSCFDLNESTKASTSVCRWFAQKPRAPVLRVITESGCEIEATADHPFWTPDGMIPLGKLQANSRVALLPFDGIPFEAPSDDIILTEEGFREKWSELGKKTGGHALEQALRFLREKQLLPLRYSSSAVPYICKILGFVNGDGNIHFVRRTGKGVVLFSGDKSNLEVIRADVEALGFSPSCVYARQRQHVIQTAYRECRFERTEEWFKVGSSGFAVLLAALGGAVGKKTHQTYSTPDWLEHAPLWQKRLFLAAFFGAEMTTPATITGHDTVFGAPTVGMNKHADHMETGRNFLERISAWLKDFGVETQAVLAEPAGTQTKQTGRLRLVLSPKAESLLNLWSKVGYEYNAKRASLAALAVHYLRHKQFHLAERVQIAADIRRWKAEGVPRSEILNRVTGRVNQRFVERVLYSDRVQIPRVREDFSRFADFVEKVRVAPGSSMVWDRIARIEPIEDYDGDVYDFTVNHPDHNFIANGFVVSNCGVRLVRTNLYYREVKNHLQTLVDSLFRSVPTGVGRAGHYSFKGKELTRLLGEGASYLTSRGLATQGDIDHTEAHGYLDGADPDEVSDHAKLRGQEQCGTLGSGNHFLEVQLVDAIFDEQAARSLGLEKDMICVMIHSGSRGLGYQVCDDALHLLRKAPEKYGIQLPDRQLACAPVNSTEGQKYIAAMRAAANFAWCNRQLLMWQAREVFADVFGRSWQELQMNLIYDVCHNIAKFEEHTVGGQKKKVWVHRKGATRAFPPGHPEVPAMYRAIGQPVIIPGDMGRASWVLVGQPGSMEKTFGTTCHGAGRAMSRTAALKEAAGRRIDKELAAKGIIARAQSRKGLAEEQPKAYKNVDDVVEVVHQAGLSKKVARMRPIGVIKG
jgi:tRNA-splicing ligase RtcB